MLSMCVRSCALLTRKSCARSRDEQCNSEESPFKRFSTENFTLQFEVFNELVIKPPKLKQLTSKTSKNIK